MATIAELEASTKRIVRDIVQRETRARVYRCTDHPDEYIVIDWRLPSGDPAKVGYPINVGQIVQLDVGYQQAGDDPIQAHTRPHDKLVTLIALARGTDALFVPKGRFADA